MNEFLELVTERPDETLIGKKIFCPYCGTEDVQTFGTRSTLVGYVGVDRNHTHTECKCSMCEKEFTWETKGFDRIWVTDPNGKVLAGIPYCFERYIYTCKHCCGDVELHHLDNETHEPAKCLSWKLNDEGRKADFYNKFVCKSCGESIISENYYLYAI